MGPKTTPSLISKGEGGVLDTLPLALDEIDTPWEIGLISTVTKILLGTKPVLIFQSKKNNLEAKISWMYKINAFVVIDYL